MNICRQCKWYLTGDCGHPETNAPISVVTGEPSYPSAWRERADGGDCGPNGVRWETKEAQFKEVAQ